MEWEVLAVDNICYVNYLINRKGELFDRKKDKLIASNYSHKGRPRVSIKLGEKRRQLYLAKLVAQQFIPIPDGMKDPAVGYKDGDKTNVEASNLYWIPRNRRHANQHLSSLCL